MLGHFWNDAVAITATVMNLQMQDSAFWRVNPTFLLARGNNHGNISFLWSNKQTKKLFDDIQSR